MHCSARLGAPYVQSPHAATQTKGAKARGDLCWRPATSALGLLSKAGIMTLRPVMASDIRLVVNYPPKGLRCLLSH